MRPQDTLLIGLIGVVIGYLYGQIIGAIFGFLIAYVASRIIIDKQGLRGLFR